MKWVLKMRFKNWVIYLIRTFHLFLKSVYVSLMWRKKTSGIGSHLSPCFRWSLSCCPLLCTPSYLGHEFQRPSCVCLPFPNRHARIIDVCTCSVWLLCGFWDLELMSSNLHGKNFTHSRIFPTPNCFFLRIDGIVLYVMAFKQLLGKPCGMIQEEDTVDTSTMSACPHSCSNGDPRMSAPDFSQGNTQENHELLSKWWTGARKTSWQYPLKRSAQEL